MANQSQHAGTIADPIPQRLLYKKGDKVYTVATGPSTSGSISSDGVTLVNNNITKGEAPAEAKSMGINYYDKDGTDNNADRLASVNYTLDTDNNAALNLMVSDATNTAEEKQTGIRIQNRAGTPRIILTNDPQADSNDQSVATTSWVRGLKATADQYGLTKLADTEDFLQPTNAVDAAVSVPLIYEVNGFRRLNTAYEVGDRVACAFKHNLFLECTQAGTTSENMLDTRNVTHGQVITDGTVQWTVKTHIRSINNTTADSNGNIQIDAGANEDKIKKIVLDLFFPIGAVYLSADNNFNPNSSWGGNWVKIEDRFLLGSGSRGVGVTGGEETHTLTESEMPSHTHSGSTSSAGNHTHTRGTIGNDLTGLGTFDPIDYRATYNASGCLSFVRGDSNRAYVESNEWYYSAVLRFSGSSGFTGSVSYAGDHSHSMSLNNTGGNRAHNNMPPFEVVNIWRRVA